MRILVAGATGTIGRAITTRLRDEHEVVRAIRGDDVSLGDIHFDAFSPVRDYEKWRADVIIYAAGASSFTKCEESPEQTRLVNVVTPVSIARNCEVKGIRFLYFSSNSAFEPDENSHGLSGEQTPRSEYGRQKSEAEDLLSRLGCVTVLRLAKVLTDDWPLVHGWARSLREAIPIRPFRDHWISPVHLSSVVQVVEQLLKVDVRGLLQLSATDQVAYADVGRQLAEFLEVDTTLVQPISAIEGGLSRSHIVSQAKLDLSRLQESLSYQPQCTRDVLKVVFSQVRP